MNKLKTNYPYDIKLWLLYFYHYLSINATTKFAKMLNVILSSFPISIIIVVKNDFYISWKVFKVLILLLLL